MAKFMIQASYNSEGAKGVLKAGGAARKAALATMIESLGGKLEAFYFAFGEDDVVLLVDVPDNVSAAAAAMTVAAGGALSRIRTTVLLTSEEIDAAAKKTVSYAAPGK
ncbi:MAG: GYD domain-containing protein [Candidatus Eremiobacteraeota bacterium]|nr:GYD domain-containing protein [Candidatus Eremiobacteraeota bacterium]